MGSAARSNFVPLPLDDGCGCNDPRDRPEDCKGSAASPAGFVDQSLAQDDQIDLAHQFIVEADRILFRRHIRQRPEVKIACGAHNRIKLANLGVHLLDTEVWSPPTT
jgi:hypothetical protein